MSTSRPSVTTGTLAAIARRFYLEDIPKSQLAEEFGFSRFKIARLLQEAREREIVTITIRDDNPIDPTLGERLAKHLRLDTAIVVPASRDINAERDNIAQAGATYLTAHLAQGQNIGLSWGRTLQPIAKYAQHLPQVKATFVQLTGVIGNDPSQSPGTMLADICSDTGSVGKALFVPLFVSTKDAAEAARQIPSVAETLSYYDRLDMAFLSIGAWESRVTQLAQHLSLEECRYLDSIGTTADLGGMFLDEHGRYLDTPMNERRISISVPELLDTPKVVVMAGGLRKARAIRAVCQSGMATVLITTDEVAKQLLDQPPVETHTYHRHSAPTN